jgi:hypothetical protein
MTVDVGESNEIMSRQDKRDAEWRDKDQRRQQDRKPQAAKSKELNNQRPKDPRIENVPRANKPNDPAVSMESSHPKKDSRCKNESLLIQFDGLCYAQDQKLLKCIRVLVSRDHVTDPRTIIATYGNSEQDDFKFKEGKFTILLEKFLEYSFLLEGCIECGSVWGCPVGCQGSRKYTSTPFSMRGNIQNISFPLLKLDRREI